MLLFCEYRLLATGAPPPAAALPPPSCGGESLNCLTRLCEFGLFRLPLLLLSLVCRPPLMLALCRRDGLERGASDAPR